MKKMTQEDTELLQSLRAELRRRFQAKGHGKQQEILKEIGIKDSTYDYSFRSGSLKVVDLMRVLRGLDLDPADFFSNIFRTERKPLKGVPPAGAQTALKRLARRRGEE